MDLNNPYDKTVWTPARIAAEVEARYQRIVGDSDISYEDATDVYNGVWYRVRVELAYTGALAPYDRDGVDRSGLDS